MQRHFSNRGEALAEVTAARMLVKPRAVKPGFVTQPGRGVSRQKLFPERMEKPPRKLQKPHVRSGSEEGTIQL